MPTINRRLLAIKTVFVLLLGLAGCKSTSSEQKIDTIAKLTIRYMNENKPDSVYFLLGEAFRKQITATTWASIYNEQLSYLLPLKNLTLISRDDSVSTYKVDGKQPLQIMLGNL